MKNINKVICALIGCMILTAQPTQAALAHPILPEQGTPPVKLPKNCDPEGEQESGALYLICVPGNWNGTLIVYAHGYVAPDEPLSNEVTLPNGLSAAEMITLMGYAFATTSYSTNGLAVPEGLADLVDLVDIFVEEKGGPDEIYITGVSLGGLIATQAVEQWPQVFDGGMALCAPNGDFVALTNYLGDFRVVFDYFFPDLLPGSPVEIPEELMENWDEHFAGIIAPAVTDPANAGLVEQLFAVTGAAYSETDEDSQLEVIERLLWYNVVGTNDTIEKLGGQPYDNSETEYSGSEDDEALNENIQRFSADEDALETIDDFFQTTGELETSLVSGHTASDPVVPYVQAELYAAKVADAGSEDQYEHMVVDGYGHCTISPTDLLGGLSRLDALVETTNDQ